MFIILKSNEMKKITYSLSLTFIVLAQLATAQSPYSPIYFDGIIRDKISLHLDRLGSTNMYGFGVEGSALYYKSPFIHRWYVNANADNGASSKLDLDVSGLELRSGDFLVQRGGEINFSWDGSKRAGIKATNSYPENELQFFTASHLESMRIDTDGKVGIGTTDPTQKLHVNDGNIYGANPTDDFLQISRKQGKASVKGIFSNTSGFDSHVIIDAGRTSDAVFLNHYISSNVYIATGGGEVGIGTTTPNEKLDVRGSIYGYSDVDAFVKIKRKQGQASIIGVFDNTPGYDGHVIIDAGRTSDAVYLNHYIESNVYVATGGGNVGIGTSNPDEKLTVKGKIHSEEVRVDLSVPGPDYVFEPNYNLTSLQETKAYIQKNKHLPEIPSAAEMEVNGIELGGMNMLLLKKIEELTLHLINQSEELTAQKKEIEALKKQVQN